MTTARRNLRYATSLTRIGKIDMTNRKPYRSQVMKDQAKVEAVKEKDGTFRCHTVPVLYHRKPVNNEL